MACFTSSHGVEVRLSSTNSVFPRRTKTADYTPAPITSAGRRFRANFLLLQTGRLLVPATRFESSKLKVVFLGEKMKNLPEIIPRIYTLTHCDLTANLTLAVSDAVNFDQLSGWYHRLQRDSIVAEWKVANAGMSLRVHCHVSGAHPLLDLAAGFRYRVFTHELPLVLQALMHGDSTLFSEHPELLQAPVWVYFHSNLIKYNRMECWGPLQEAAQRRSSDGGEQDEFLREGEESTKSWAIPGLIFQALSALLL